MDGVSRRFSCVWVTLLLLSLSSTRRLPLIFVFLMFGVSAVRSERPDVPVPVSCSAEEDCFLPCHFPKQLTEIIWVFDRMPVQWYPRSITLHQHYRFKNRTSLNEHEALNGNCSLTIRGMKPKDNGVYECVVKSQSGTKESRKYNISVYVPIENVTIVRSGDLLICSSRQIYPEPQCQWADDLPNSGPSVHQDDQDLYSTNCTTPVQQNVSLYRCTVSTFHSSRSATYRELPPLFVSGTKVTLPCGPSSVLAKSVMWTFNNSETILNQRHGEKWEASERWRPFVKSLSESGNLTLIKLSSDHQGLFTCVLSTDTEIYTVNMQLQKQSFSIWTIVTAIIIAVLLTAVILRAHKTCPVPSEAQQDEVQPSLPQSSSSANSPDDWLHIVRIICGLQGLGSVLPWHFFVTALLYFKQRVNGSDQTWIFSFIVLIPHGAQLLSVCVNHYRVPRFALRKHITGCLIGITLQFVVVLVSMMVQIDGETFFGISMCAFWLASLFSAMVQHHLSVEVNLLPHPHIHSFAHGKASAGIVASLVMIVFLATTEDDLSAVFHFVFAGVASLVTLISYCVLPNLEFAKHYFNQQRQRRECANELLNIKDDDNNNDQERPHSPDWKKQSWSEKVCVVLVPLLTFSVYPVITADVHTVHLGKWGRFFIAVCCFLSFNFFNLVGQKIPVVSWAHKYFPITFPLLTVIHSIFIILFMLCNVQPRSLIPLNTHLSSDVAFSIIMVLFSLSNGFLTHFSMFYVPNPEENGDSDRSKIICTALGSVIGALLSFGLRALI